LLVVLWLLASVSCADQALDGPRATGWIRGVVRDEYRHVALPGASVASRESGDSTRCDDEGRFQLRVPAGPSTLEVSADGYLTLERDEDPVTAGGTLEDQF